MQSGYEGIKSEGATMIAISGDNQQGVSNLQQVRGTTITYLILADDENDLQTISDYNVLHPVFENIARPATYIIDEGGKIVWKDLGDRYGHRTNSQQIVSALQGLSN